MKQIAYIKEEKKSSLAKRHPWLYTGSFLSVEAASGEAITILDRNGGFLCRGLYTEKSKIAVRIFTWNDEPLDRKWFERRLSTAINRRKTETADDYEGARRLVYSEADGLPGLIIDRYAGLLVIQALTVGIAKRIGMITEIITSLTGLHDVVRVDDIEMARKEGFEPVRAVVSGKYDGEMEIREHGLTYRVDPFKGQKTGFYLDQRINRKSVGAYAAGKNVLDLFCYSGGFTCNAMAGGAAEICCIDSSDTALELLQRNVIANFGDDNRLSVRREDVFSALRNLKKEEARFDLIVLDPPKLAPSRRDLDKALRGYKDLALHALSLLNDTGILMTFSCSQAVSQETLEEVTRWASFDAGCDLRLRERLLQADDHPVILSFPESEYLKGCMFEKC